MTSFEEELLEYMSTPVDPSTDYGALLPYIIRMPDLPKDPREREEFLRSIDNGGAGVLVVPEDLNVPHTQKSHRSAS